MDPSSCICYPWGSLEQPATPSRPRTEDSGSVVDLDSNSAVPTSNPSLLGRPIGEYTLRFQLLDEELLVDHGHMDPPTGICPPAGTIGYQPGPYQDLAGLDSSLSTSPETLVVARPPYIDYPADVCAASPSLLEHQTWSQLATDQTIANTALTAPGPPTTVIFSPQVPFVGPITITSPGQEQRGPYDVDFRPPFRPLVARAEGYGSNLPHEPAPVDSTVPRRGTRKRKKKREPGDRRRERIG